MHQELAIKKNQENWPLTVLSGLKDMISSVHPHRAIPDTGTLTEHLGKILAVFPADEIRVRGYKDILLGSDVAGYGSQATEIFTHWDQEEGGGPSLPAFVALAAEHFQLPVDGPEIRAAMVAAVLAELPNTLLYHGNEHYRKVIFHTIRLLATHQSSDFPHQPVFDKSDLIKTLIAATIHDLGHEGGDNLRDGIYTPGYMEQKAFDIMRPYFDFLDIDRDFWAEIETAVFCTDITFFAGDNSPCVRMKKIYNSFFNPGLVSGEDVESMLIGKLRLFEDNRKLAVMAMLLHEADIATSAGLSYEQSRIETVNIMQERGVTTTGPQTLLRFLNEQLNGKMMTPAAQKLFSGEMAKIMDKARDDIDSGISQF